MSDGQDVLECWSRIQKNRSMCSFWGPCPRLGLEASIALCLSNVLCKAAFGSMLNRRGGLMVPADISVCSTRQQTVVDQERDEKKIHSN